MNAPLSEIRTLGSCATLACLWEATAPKPGNVYRGADFDDATYADFLTSAAVIGPAIEMAAGQGVGAAVLSAVQATQTAVATNTNLGTVLLLAPLAAVPREKSIANGIAEVLSACDEHDTRQVYQAIRTAHPAGLGKVQQADVQETPTIPLQEAMRLAASRDLVARQYTNHFQQVQQVANSLSQGVQQGWPLAQSIVHSFLTLLAEHPDSLIARKCGDEDASEVSVRSAAVLAQGEPGQEDYERGLTELDFWLRSDGHRRNPGTSADLIAAGLFVLLRDDRLNWPVRFY